VVRHPEAVLFSLCWAALAATGGVLGGWIAGLLLSIGLLAILMPTSALILQRTGDFAAERKARWSLLGVAALILIIWSATAY
jgi:uncharacterized membrane protein YhaH (DUF805 family)